MITFRIVPHAVVAGSELVEIMRDGAVVAVVYPYGKSAFRVVSAHFGRVWQDTGVGKVPPIPSIEVEIDPKPYHIENGRIVRESQH